MSAQRAGWSTPSEAFRLWFAPTTPRKTLKIALVVGIILSVINIGLQLPTPARIVLNFLVPLLRLQHRGLVGDAAAPGSCGWLT